MAIQKSLGRIQVLEAAIEAIVRTMDAEKKKAFRNNLTALVNDRLAEIDQEVENEREEAKIDITIPRLDMGAYPRSAEEIELEISELNEHRDRLIARCS